MTRAPSGPKSRARCLTLDAALQDTLPPCWRSWMRCRTTARFAPSIRRSGASAPSTGSSACCCAKARCSPCCWSLRICTGSIPRPRRSLDSLVESLPTARLLLLVNYRPEYQHGWGSKTYYTQLRLDPLPPGQCRRILAGTAGGRPQPGATHAAADCPHGGQSVLSGGERAHPGGDRGAGGDRAPIAWRRPLRRLAGASHRAGGAGGAHRPAATRRRSACSRRRR